MHTSYIQQPYPSFLSHVYNQNYSTLSQKPIQSDTEDDSQSYTGIPSKKNARIIPDEEKDTTYYEKRARNNESAKRSRDTRRIKEQHIQDRVSFLEQENSRLSMENHAIRYQISQLHVLCSGGSKPLQ